MATQARVEAKKIASVNPATGEVLRELDCATESEVVAAVATARAAQPAWNELGLRRRLDILREFQARLHAKKSEIAEAITREAGKPVAEALTTITLIGNT